MQNRIMKVDSLIKMVHFLHQVLAKVLNTSLEQSAKLPEILFKRLKSSESDQK